MAIPSNLSANELDALGFRRTKVVAIEIVSQNGRPLTGSLPDDLLLHFWNVLGQNSDNLDNIRSNSTVNQSLRIYYRVKEVVHLPHISQSVTFDFFEIIPVIYIHLDIQPIVYQCILLGPADAC